MDPQNWKVLPDKAFEKMPVERVYEDLLSPSLKQAGQALATVFEFVGTTLLPLKVANLRARVWMEQYETNLKSRTSEPIKVPASIGVPIVQKLSVLEENDLSKAFINLLTNASFEETIHLVHPAFVTTLADLSTDEAKLLFELRNTRTVPFINIELYTNLDKANPQQRSFRREFMQLATGLEKRFQLSYPQNITLYLHNLERLGIMGAMQRAELGDHEEAYKMLEEVYYAEEIFSAQGIAEAETAQPEKRVFANVIRSHLNKTDFGRAFTQACLTNYDVETD